jgi:outer membrane protein OmpA-like peptidoglycan-associated protein
MALGVVSLGGCATKKFVRETIAPVAGQVQTQEGHLATLDKATADAMARADAAGKLAEGKFLYSMVLSDDSVKFARGKATLSEEAKSRLDAFANKLKTDNKNVYVEVQGHTDATEARASGYQLGRDRAEAVRRYLNQQGVALNRISTISYGADAPVSSNSDPAGRQANRRVVLIVLS